MSRWTDAVRHFEFALKMNEQMGCRPWLAHTQYDYGRMLLARGDFSDREPGLALIAAGRKLSRELGMDALARKIEVLTACTPSESAASA
jgi:hypothetical protein